MSFKKIIGILIFTGLISPLFAAEQWRIAVADLHLLSVKDPLTISKVLKKSFVSQLEEVKDFKILKTKSGLKEVNNRSQALQQARLAEADVIIYGSYYIQNDKLVFFVEILDVLSDKIKLRNYYTGDLSLDLFDTIDEVSAQIVQSVRQALPEFTTESEVEIKKIRKTVYKSQDLKLKRLFYTHLGFNSEVGYKEFSYLDEETNTIEYNGKFPSTQLELGITIRFGNIRFDGSLTGLMGVPGYYSIDKQQAISIKESPGFGRVSLTWYPRFLQDNYALGIGLNNFTPLVATNNDNGVLGMSYLRNNGRSLTLFFFTHAIPNLELEAGIKLPIFDSSTHPSFISTNEVNNDQEWMDIKTLWPATTLSLTWFPSKNFGIKARFYYEKGDYARGKYDTQISVNGTYLEKASYIGGDLIETLSLYLGVVYKADFL